MMGDMSTFTFVDLFAGIGGFHAALSALGGECVYAVEIDEQAARVYENNWGIDPKGDITVDANDDVMNVPPHDVLCAGFPCQPFSKSGAQRGMDETRGTLFWHILEIVHKRKPKVVLLENVRNLAGPRHRHEWQIIVESLRDEGYVISDTPSILSPHLLSPEEAGSPQSRERVFITATHDPKGVRGSIPVDPIRIPSERFDPQTWDLGLDLPLEGGEAIDGCQLTPEEIHWINAWDDFVHLMHAARSGRRLPGFPLWADSWQDFRREIDPSLPKWKASHLAKNYEFYGQHRRILDDWADRWGVFTDLFPPSRRKFEWQAQDAESLWDCVMHLRPSGLRAKRATYLPALVAITQTSIIGPRRRRLSPREAARLQGLPDWFSFGDQPSAATYRQLGNGVHIGVIWYALREHVLRDEEILKRSSTGRRLLDAVTSESTGELQRRLAAGPPRVHRATPAPDVTMAGLPAPPQSRSTGWPALTHSL